MMGVTAIYPGSFDPITNGHLDIIHRTSRLFDNVIVAVLVNRKKQPTFTVEERIEMLKKVTQDIPNVSIGHFDGLLADYAARCGATVIVRGLRAVSDFEYEFQMSLANKMLNPNVETVFLNTTGSNLFISSSLVKEIAGYGGDIRAFVPRRIADEIIDRIGTNS